MTKIGILGGAFNPPTTEHIELSQFVLDNTDVKEVWLVPCYGHMYGKNMESPQHRVEMCRLAVKSEMFVFDYEIRNKMSGSSYDFVKSLMSGPYSDIEPSLIIGQDNADTLDKWKNAEELKTLVRFIVIGRGGYDTKRDWYMNPPHIHLPNDREACSSTEVRKHLQDNGYKPHKNLDGKVLEYIKSYNLYPNSHLLDSVEKEAVLK